MTTFADLHRASTAEVFDAESSRWLVVLVLDDLHECEKGCPWLVVQPLGTCKPRKVHAAADALVHLAPRPPTWMSVTNAAVRLRLPVRQVMVMAASGEITSRLVVDHYEVFAPAVDRFNLGSSASAELAALTGDRLAVYGADNTGEA